MIAKPTQQLIAPAQFQRSQYTRARARLSAFLDRRSADTGTPRGRDHLHGRSVDSESGTVKRFCPSPFTPTWLSLRGMPL